MTEITLAQLQAICNTPDSAGVLVPFLNKYMAQYQINTHQRICGFLGQVIEESAAFRCMKEDISDAQAERNYGSRKDLGNIHPGDGAKFKGRGLIQITGRNNYADVSMHLFKDYRLLETPELLEQPDGAVQSACWYWFSRDLNAIMDVDIAHKWKVTVYGKPEVFTTFQWATLKINGGLNGYATRLKYFEKALEVIPRKGVSDPASVANQAEGSPAPSQRKGDPPGKEITALPKGQHEA